MTSRKKSLSNVAGSPGAGHSGSPAGSVHFGEVAKSPPKSSGPAGHNLRASDSLPNLRLHEPLLPHDSLMQLSEDLIRSQSLEQIGNFLPGAPAGGLQRSSTFVEKLASYAGNDGTFLWQMTGLDEDSSDEEAGKAEVTLRKRSSVNVTKADARMMGAVGKILEGDDEAVDAELGPDVVGNAQPNHGGLNSTRTVATIMKAMIGSGVLFLPNGFKQAGVLSGCVMIVFSSVLSTYCMILLMELSGTPHSTVFGHEFLTPDPSAPVPDPEPEPVTDPDLAPGTVPDPLARVPTP